MTIPLHLNVPAFLAKWEAWVAFRKRMHKVGDWDAMFNEQLSFLDRHTVEEAVEILSQSIRNGWRGLFTVKAGKGGVEFKRAGTVWSWQQQRQAIIARLRAIKEDRKNFNWKLGSGPADVVHHLEATKPDGWEERVKMIKGSWLNYDNMGLKPEIQAEFDQLMMDKSEFEQLLMRGNSNES